MASADAPSSPPHRPSGSLSPFPLALGGLGVAGAEGVIGYLHPAVGMSLAIADAAVPIVIILTVVGTVIFGSERACERVFRLLRWLANRPEPPPPAGPRAAAP